MPTVTNLGLGGPLSQSEMRRANPTIVNGRMDRPPLRWIYIHTVSKQTFGPMTRFFFKGKIHGCEPGQRYRTIAPIPDPFPESINDEMRGGNIYVDHDAWRLCIDLLNPNNPTNDPYWNNTGSVPAFVSTSQNCDLISQGVWPSLFKEPPEEEIKRAEKARDDRYRAMTQNAIRLASKSRKELNDYLQDHPYVHEAMDSLGLKADWHQSVEVREFCPNCGDEIRQEIGRAHV